MLLILIFFVFGTQGVWTRLQDHPEQHQFESRDGSQSEKFNKVRQGLAINGLSNCNTSEEAFFNCVRTLADLDNDGVITEAEVASMFSRPGFYSANMNTAWVMEQGDYNHDGVLTMDDWGNENRTLFYKDGMTPMFACFFCRSNGVNMDAN